MTARRAVLMIVVLAVVFLAVGAVRDTGPLAGAEGEPSSCTTVAVVGDSLTAMARDRIVRALEARGMEPRVTAWSGRRTTVDNISWRGSTIPSGLSAIDTVRSWDVDEPSCWVIALGTNDIEWRQGRARQFGATFQANNRTVIDTMLAQLGDTPAQILWVNIANQGNRGLTDRFNADLVDHAQGRYSVIDWATPAYTHPGWWLDNKHVNEDGQWFRAQLIARAVTELPVTS